MNKLTHALIGRNKLELALVRSTLESEESAVDSLENVDGISENIDGGCVVQA